jgi:hypothetical protein
VEQHLVTTDVDFRSFKPGPTVEIVIIDDWGPQIIPGVSRRGVWLKMEVVSIGVHKSRIRKPGVQIIASCRYIFLETRGIFRVVSPFCCP